MMNPHFAIIKKSFLRLGIAVVLAAGALWLFFSNMRYSIQFTGGMEMVVDSQIDTTLVSELTTVLQTKGYNDFSVGLGEKDGYDSVILQIDIAEDKQVVTLTETVKETLLATNTIASTDNILESSVTGPSI
jgi:preprotein translocase subunit SecF